MAFSFVGLGIYICRLSHCHGAVFQYIIEGVEELAEINFLIFVFLKANSYL